MHFNHKFSFCLHINFTEPKSFIHTYIKKHDSPKITLYIHVTNEKGFIPPNNETHTHQAIITDYANGISKLTEINFNTPNKGLNNASF